MLETELKKMGEPATVRNIHIDERHVEQRLDNFLVSLLKGVPKTLIYRIIRKGEVRVNKKRAKAFSRLSQGDVVRIPPVRTATTNKLPKPSISYSRLLESSVIYEDDVLIVLNKPSGIAVHGGSGVRLGVIESLRQLRPDSKFLELVHRIDKDTSGCLMVAKKRSMLRHLHEQIRLARVYKSYTALVAGSWPSRIQTVNASLVKNVLKSGERIVLVSEDGKASRTRFKVIGRYKGCSLLNVILDTGRTHQIRVHTRHVGHPIIADLKYGDDDINKKMKNMGIRRLMLHASSLGITTLNGERMEFVAPLPDDFERGLKNLS